MQVSATLIAAQQAAREAQARFQQTHAPTLQASFASALTETGKTEGFSALPLKQTAPQAASPSAAGPPSTATPTRLGQHLDITV
jgi:hypothetical protein